MLHKNLDFFFFFLLGVSLLLRINSNYASKVYLENCTANKLATMSSSLLL